MRLFWSFVVLFWMCSVQGQDMQEHVVADGETVLAISKKYSIDPSEIYRHNRFALDGISPGMQLKVPQVAKTTKVETPKTEVQVMPVEVASTTVEVPVTKVPEKTTEKLVNEVAIRKTAMNYTVGQGETLYGISKKFQVTLDELYKANPGLKEKGLQARQNLVIPALGTVFENQPKPTETVEKKSEVKETITHLVKKGETLYSLSRQYGVSVELITRQNEKVLQRGLQAGQTLTITP
jgi:LysM repeat protein